MRAALKQVKYPCDEAGGGTLSIPSSSSLRCATGFLVLNVLWSLAHIAAQSGKVDKASFHGRCAQG